MKLKMIGVMFLITWVSPVFAAQPLLFNTTATGFPPFFVKSARSGKWHYVRCDAVY